MKKRRFLLRFFDVSLECLLGRTSDPSWTLSDSSGDPLGTLLGLSWAPLGRSWGALGRAWGALGALLGALGPLLGHSWDDMQN